MSLDIKDQLFEDYQKLLAVTKQPDGEVEAIREKYQKLLADSDQMREELKKTRENCRLLRDECESLRQQIDDQSQLADVDEAVEIEDSEEVTELRQELAEARAENRLVRDREKQLSEQLRSLRQQLAKPQSVRVETSGQTQDQLKRDLELANLDRNDLRSQLEKAKSEIDRLVEQRERNRHRN